ncbi:CatB-related O-acetyltransferase [Ensifer sp. ENS04]|uniref:CatB-related O-acetyltransferase n=1 Tax=Ensifer sp. ENS04 TaxID=2769281 RepID=UPI001FEFD7F1|nr:CatB-related O-acetyltransferase [Ensifer sp. ENS04]
MRRPVESALYPFLDVIGEAYVGKGDTVIGDGAWIGMRAMIMPGVTLGEGAVIASGAIVTKDVAPYTIVAGNPARPVRQRFPATDVETLIALGIYQWERSKFDALRRFICADDIAALKAASEEYDSRQA